MFVSDESSFFKVATKESPSHPEKVLTGCKNSSSKTVPAGILFVLASALKAPAKAAKKEAEQEMTLQFGGREIKEKDLYERIQQIWIEGYGKKAEELKSLKVYVKPEEFTAYYVINDDVTGSIDL